MNQVDSVPDALFIETASKAVSRYNILQLLGIPIKGSNNRKVKLRLDKLNISEEVFKRNKLLKFKQCKVCPVCNKEFWVSKKGRESNRVCCSHACANTFFRSGKNNPTFLKNPRYTTKCFLDHKKECIICGEQNIVAVHHFDENHNNNEISNLIPLCPTHHQYMHSKFKELILDKVIAYQEQFKNRV